MTDSPIAARALSFGAVASELAERTVLSAARQRRLVQRALDIEGLSENPAYFEATLSAIRKAIACEETLDSYDPRHVVVAHRYEQLLSAVDAASESA